MPDAEWISDLDAAGACAAVVRLHGERVRAEFALFAPRPPRRRRRRC